MNNNTQSFSPPATVGFTQEPNCGRGTISIIWNCLATIFLCTYTSLHFNVPTYRWKKRGQLLNVMAGIMAPELVAMCAYIEWTHARKILRLMHEQDMASASMSDAYFLFMGGIAIQTKGSIISVRDSNAEEALKLPRLKRDFPTKDEIADKCKVDFLGKLLTLCQILWFLAQTLTRHFQGKASALIEVSTISYILLNLMCYIFWFNKPCGIKSKLTIPIDDADIATSQDDGLGGSLRNRNQIGLYFLWAFLCLIFSGVHCLAWRYQFPSTPEAWLWRVSSLACFVTGFLSIAIFFHNTTNRQDGVSFTCLLAYIFARLCLAVLVFVSFRSAPASVYAQVDWALYISLF